jgi:hypothetical protein
VAGRVWRLWVCHGRGLVAPQLQLRVVCSCEVVELLTCWRERSWWPCEEDLKVVCRLCGIAGEFSERGSVRAAMGFSQHWTKGGGTGAIGASCAVCAVSPGISLSRFLYPISYTEWACPTALCRRQSAACAHILRTCHGAPTKVQAPAQMILLVADSPLEGASPQSLFLEQSIRPVFVLEP